MPKNARKPYLAQIGKVRAFFAVNKERQRLVLDRLSSYA